MATFRAVGGVSETLRALLKDRMDLPDEHPSIQNFDVTVSQPTPRNPQSDPVADVPRVNLFLYRVTENEFLKNQEIPGQGHPGTYGRPPLSLNLHYLVTAYGSTGASPPHDETASHNLLGSAMRVLHDYPIVTDKLTRIRDPIGEPILAKALQGEFESVKIVMEPLSVEDTSKLFTALMHPYRPSAGYLVSVVQLDSRQRRSFPRLVGEPPGGPRVVVLPLRTPEIRDLLVKWQDDLTGRERTQPYARVGDTLVLRGSGFTGESVWANLGALQLRVTPLREDLIEVTIPDDVVPAPGTGTIAEEDRLQPGPHSLSVTLKVPEMPHAGFTSPRAVVMLVPKVGTPVYDLTTLPRSLVVTGKRLYASRLSGESIVGRIVVDKASYRDATGTSIRLPLPDTLPIAKGACLLSGDLAAYPALLAGSPEVEVDVGGTKRIVTLSGIDTLAKAAKALQSGIRAHSSLGLAWTGARVAVVQDRLLVLPGGMRDAVAVGATASDATTAAQLKLAAPLGTSRTAYLSGALSPFPALTNATPRMLLTVGATEHEVELGAAPTTLADAATSLQAALVAAGVASPLVGVVESQLAVLVDDGGTVLFDKHASDATTAAQLQLRVSLPLRVRVNGTESLDPVEVPFP